MNLDFLLTMIDNTFAMCQQSRDLNVQEGISTVFAAKGRLHPLLVRGRSLDHWQFQKCCAHAKCLISGKNQRL